MSPRTIQFYQGYLGRFQGAIPVGLLVVTRDIIYGFLDSLECKPGGKHAYFRVLRAFYRWLEEDEIIENDPTRLMKAPKVPKPLRHSVSLQDLVLLLTASESVRDKLIVSMLADTGVRRSELATIEVADIDQDRRIIRVWGKGARQRLVRYGPSTAELLNEYEQNSHPSGALFGLKPWGITKVLKTLELKTGIKCNAHAFRRTFATESVRNDLNLFYVQSLLGHSSLTMTRIYAEQVSSEDAIAAYKPIVA